MTNSTDVSDVKMTRFGYRIDLISERHVRVKDEAKIASRGTDWDDNIMIVYQQYSAIISNLSISDR